ncbi:hypothetical protein CRYUN_Cryun11dG0092800 [Craigia yunnanensis]
MEIDLNHAVNEVEKTALCNVDCDKAIACVYCLSSSSSSCASNSASPPCSSSIYLELWHACAGPLTSLPKKGNFVVYFPQGQLEQVASASPFSPLEMPTFDLPPQIFCKVVNVQHLANKENDEVYTQVTLVPQPELGRPDLEGKLLDELGVDEGGGGSPIKSTPHMFCKTLTASDTSTHGGFSVPRRAAEDCFPPLDYKQTRPSQELVAKDLHGVEWRFRHIYRGQPRRHLLTTGWSIFVSQKNLVAGDAVLFLRGEDGELRLGIRKAVRPRNGIPDSVIAKQNSYPNVLSPVANAISTKSMFHVFYSPRASHAEFVIPFQKYIKSITNPVCTGTRFKMRFEMDDSPERSGVVTGIRDSDPYRWPNSKWRCLMVRWDEDIGSDHQERVSPWEIDPSVSLPPLSIQSSPRLKKLRTGLQAAAPDTPITGVIVDGVRKPSALNEHKPLENISSPAFGKKLMNQQDDCFKGNVVGCKLFGFSLTAESPTPGSQNSGKRSCTKVHKQGSLVGRAIDLSRLYGYDDLITELERLFSMEGLLSDPDKGWRVLYTDSENDVMVVGDDPWHEFCDMVSKIHIYTQEEVEKMTIGMATDDTQSCLEQAPVIMEASKSSSVGQPDSSPTVIRVLG